MIRFISRMAASAVALVDGLARLRDVPGGPRPPPAGLYRTVGGRRPAESAAMLQRRRIDDLECEANAMTVAPRAAG